MNRTEETKTDSPSVSPLWLVAFSRHRPKEGEPGRSRSEIEACAGMLRSTLEELGERAHDNGGTIELTCSCADGADLVAIDVTRTNLAPSQK